MNVLITVIFPKGVINLLFHMLVKFSNCCIFIVQFSLIICFRSTLKIIPKILNLLLPQESFHLVLIALVLCFFEPIHTTCVLSKLILRPYTFANLSRSVNVQFRASDDPSKNIDVSSAYCEILNSVS